jgi:hypothetical protein
MHKLYSHAIVFACYEIHAGVEMHVSIFSTGVGSIECTHQVLLFSLDKPWRLIKGCKTEK